MRFAELAELIQSRFAAEVNVQNPQPYLTVQAADLLPVGQFLRDDDRLYFDGLVCITAIDNGPEADTMTVFYNFASIPYEHTLMLRVDVPRQTATGQLPELPSLSHLWRTADWHEREAYDLLGIAFTDHPDLRRILLPTDWPGHPLRRDYVEPAQYHGIRTD
jgi:NADH-quinone oxidoreductase subunit C